MGLRFPRGQFNAIQREKEGDRDTPIALLPSRISELAEKEKKLNKMYWSFWSRGKCTDEVLSLYFRDERNALRVRISRLQRKMS